MNLAELGRYKKKIISLFLANDDIVDLMLPVKNPGYDADTQLLGYTDSKGNVVFKGQLFPYYYTNGSNETARTFVLVDTEVPEVSRNGLFKSIYMYIYEFTHLSLVRLSTAEQAKYIKKGYEGVCRTDVLAAAIDDVLNKNQTFGIGDVELKSVKIYKPVDDYYGRLLIYKVNCENISGDYCGN